MEQITEHNPAQSRRESVLPRCGRLVHSLAVRVLWPATHLGFLHVTCSGDICLVWRCYKF